MSDIRNVSNFCANAPMDAERREQPPDVFQFIIHDDDHDEDRRARDVELLIDPKYFPLHLARGLIIGQPAGC